MSTNVQPFLMGAGRAANDRPRPIEPEKEETPLRFDCPMCQFAYECQSRAWECDSCGRRIDLRTDAQHSLIRDDGQLNLDRRTA